MPGVKTVAAAHGAQAMIHGLGSGFRIAIELMTDVFREGGLSNLGKGQMSRFEPAGEIEKIVGVDAKRMGRKLAKALTIQESVHPRELSSLVVTHAIG